MIIDSSHICRDMKWLFNVQWEVYLDHKAYRDAIPQGIHASGLKSIPFEYSFELPSDHPSIGEFEFPSEVKYRRMENDDYRFKHSVHVCAWEILQPRSFGQKPCLLYNKLQSTRMERGRAVIKLAEVSIVWFVSFIMVCLFSGRIFIIQMKPTPQRKYEEQLMCCDCWRQIRWWKITRW